MSGFAYRIRDVLVSGLALIVLSPLLLFLMLALRLTQKRVFFRQQRPGYQGVPFFLVKFSTLYDAPPGWKEEERQRERLTPLGKYLRQWSLDELPQLWNVLRGDMSLVGPRPLLMQYLPLYSPEQFRRHDVLPGITGWAQIHGRNALTFSERFVFDLWYVDHQSFWLDMKIIWHTFARVLKRQDVYASSVTTSALFDGKN